LVVDADLQQVAAELDPIVEQEADGDKRPDGRKEGEIAKSVALVST
jgi:hypothetical protein